jgi:hypothetical protein
VILGALALGSLLQALDSLPALELTGGWPEWALGLIGAAGVEAGAWLYSSERRTVKRSAGVAMTVLRLLAVLVVVGLLARPVLRLEWEERRQRTVAVLVDDSASMHVADTDPTPARRVRLAEALMPDAPERPYRLDEVSRELQNASSRLRSMADRVAAIAELSPTARERQMAASADDLQKGLADVSGTAQETVQAIRAPLDGQLPLGTPTREALQELATELTDRVVGPLDQLANGIGESRALAALSTLQGVATTLQDAASLADRLGEDLDATFYTALPESVQERMAENAARPRARLTRDLLLGPTEDTGNGVGALNELSGQGYGLRSYAFASEAQPVGFGDDEGDPEAAELASRQATNMADALRRVLTDIPAEDLAGVLLVTDGLHNTPAEPEPLARRLGDSGVPVSTVVVGSRRPPADAAITALNAPETAIAGDALYVSADVKLHGMDGQVAEVYLAQGDTIVDSMEIEARGDSWRERIELSHTPETDGDVEYRVGVRPPEDDVLPRNNEYPMLVRVTDERTKVLVLEGRPRWEFRYVRNLFAARDKAVQLQWVLAHPEKITGQPQPPEVVASVSNPIDRPRATEPPQTLEEWLRFDVIILGDIPRDMLAPADWAAIEKFVVDRGGTLVVIAGPTHMPHKFADTPLNGMLPVEFRSSQEYQSAPETSYRIALTEAGQRSIMLRLEGTPEANDHAWEQVPEVYWRHPLTRALPTAEVLAYADTGATDTTREQMLDRALVTTTNQALGRVVFLAFDRTWRLRYKHSDRYHYKFWGQLLRWAAGPQLPAGTEQVRLGTDRTRYGLDTPVRITARLVDTERTPVGGADVRARITRNGVTVARPTLEYDPLQPGTYTAAVSGLAPGSYQVQVTGRDVEELLAREGEANVQTSFTVEPSAPTEHLELAANLALPRRMAEDSGGVAVRPWMTAAALASLRPAELVQSKVYERPLWNFWPMLALLVGLLAAEWILRKRTGLP